MITLTTFPNGRKLTENILDAEMTDLGGDALVTTLFSHGLISGQVLFIQSDFERFNGYKFIQNESVTSFKLSNTFGGDPLEYLDDSSVTYQISIYNHTAMAVHNPIVYELDNDLYPTNVDEEAYVPAVVTSQANVNGYTELTLSGNLSDATPLAWIIINEVPYQIISASSDSVVVINLAYDVDNGFIGPVVKYYNNYCINVNVWVGYEGTHKWASIKPYEIAATLKFIPDANNSTKFSISDIVRSYITTRNKLDLNTLPNNTDFSAGFYISYWETYDESDGLEVTTFVGDVETQALINAGLGVNAMMPFKSQDSGYMSEYVRFGAYQSKWLLLQESITWIVGKFMDISFLTIGYTQETMEVRQNDVVIDTIDNPSNGVIRIPLTFDTAGEYCIAIWQPASAGSPEVINDITANVPLKADWYNLDVTGTDVPWTIDTQPDVILNGGTPADNVRSDYLAFDFPFVAGRIYELMIRLGVTYAPGPQNPRSVSLDIFNSSNVSQFSLVDVLPAASGYDTYTITFTANGTCVKAGIRTTAGSDRTVVWDGAPTTDVTLIETTPAVPAVSEEQITEEICITVVDECDSTFIPDGDIRLLEDGDFRILE